MTEFIPPYPERPREPLPVLAMIAAARRNFLAIFEDKCFEYQFFSSRILNRQVFVCNSPDTVAQSFIAMHESGKIDLSCLMDRQYRLEDLPQAFADLEAGRITRGCVVFD